MSDSPSASSEIARPTVTIGVRFHRIEYLPLLRRALYSLAAQEGVRVHVIVCCQGFGADEIQTVSLLCEKIFGICDAIWRVVSINNPEEKDLRSRLLNEIVRIHYSETDNKYISFLDYDDIWFSTAARTLVEAIESGYYALSFGDIHCANVYYDNGETFIREIKDFFEIGQKTKFDLLATNFLPLHSYMFNTSLLDMDTLTYDESLERLEDYDVLLRVARDHAITPFASRTLIGLYNLYSTVGAEINTTKNFFEPFDHEADPLWKAAMARIRTKQGGHPVQIFLGEAWLGPT